MPPLTPTRLLLAAFCLPSFLTIGAHELNLYRSIAATVSVKFKSLP